MRINYLLALLGLSTLFGCSIVTGKSHKDEQLLPDSGQTTTDILTGTHTRNQYYGNGQRADYFGESIQPHYKSSSRYSNAHIEELQRDFKRVPNPEIIGYVYAHITENEMPVPGYFTTFSLYQRSHFALSSEGYNQ